MSLRRLCVVCLVAALAPLWLGPMLTPIEQAFGAVHHVCACGMAVGTCGCPECEELERQHRLDEASPRPLLKGDCERNAGLLGAADLPPVVLPAALGVIPAPAVAELLPLARRSVVSVPNGPPPTPPPRQNS